MSQPHRSTKKRRSFRHTSRWNVLNNRMARLRQVEERMDDLFLQVLRAGSEQDLLNAVGRFDVLVAAYPELRLTAQLARYPDETWQLVSQLDPDHGLLPGFEAAIAQLCELCLTPQAVHGLRSKVYTVAAQVAREQPELLPTAAVAALSLDPVHMPRTVFTEMVICASAIEWVERSRPNTRDPISLDVGTWLAAEPSERLLAAAGEKQAYYYASIPGVLPFLDRRCVLFDMCLLLPYAENMPECNIERDSRLLDDLADRQYQRRLRTEIERTQTTLRQKHSALSIADLEMLTHRALEALDDLPPQVNPLIQAIWVQSWVQCLHELCGLKLVEASAYEW